MAARFVSDMEREMQGIKERFNTQILSLLGSRTVKIMGYVFHPSTIRRETLLRKDLRDMPDDCF